MVNWLKEQKEKDLYVTDYRKDKNLVFLLEKFDKRVEKEEYEEDEEFLKEAEKRFENNVPPGFRDSEKKGKEKYGDLILWKQIISKAKKDKKDVIFVTNDRKDDWWEITHGKTIGPKPELIKEFFR